MNWLTNLVMPNWLRFVLMYILPLAILLGITYAIYNCGVSDEHERNVATDNAALAKASQRNFELQTKAREDERASVKKTNELTVNFEKRINDAQTKTNSALHDVSTGAVRLRVSTRANVPANGDSAAKISTLTSRASEGSAELSEAAAGFLINLASECDSAADKLNLAIDVATSDREATTPSLRATPSKEGELSAEFIPLRDEGVARSDKVNCCEATREGALGYGVVEGQ